MTSYRPFAHRRIAGLLFSTVLVAVATISLSAPLRAQQTAQDGERVAPEFRAGQWGAQFTATSGFAGAGVLRFRSPQTAWTLDGTVAISTNTRSNSPIIYQTGDMSAASVSTRLGLRRYAAPHGPIRSFYGGGIHAGVGRSSTEQRNIMDSPSVTQTTSGYNAGAFGEVGASYFVTSHLALGARGAGTVGFERSNRETKGSGSAQKQSSNGVNLRLGSVLLDVTLFF